MTFYDRTEELDALRTAFEAPGHDFFVVYGRRRVGKTALLKEFCTDRPHVYYLVAQEAETRQREKFVERIADRFDDRLPRIEDWPDAFDYLGEKLAAEDAIVVVDEFPYLVEENDSLPSYVQAFVDERLQATNSMLVLCGSSVSVMESEVLAHKSPLYGRRTGQIDLQPFSFAQAREVIDYGFETAIRSYAVTGGTPMYLLLFDYDESLADNIRTRVLSPTAVLYNEPEFLLRTELRSPARYMSILEAIATGHTTPNEISGATNIDPGPLSKYLQTLRRLRLVDREVPVTASSKKSKRSLYRVADEFLRFWFRYVEPHRSSIEEAPELVYEDTIEPDLPTHIGMSFEEICTEAVWAGVRSGVLDRYSTVGRWWFGGDEIDIVGLAAKDDRILLAECKWTSEPVGYSLVEDLREKAERVRWGPETRTERFALFSKSGFVDGLADELDDNWHLFGLDELDRLLSP
ncbi:ATP-binding protein [Halomarina pelagica]|uniref:ATP-binding protein n=1 Tax=Halomarina pelagica TaxID=2961599 RepID=UPI0020C2BA6A|nr:ATP-binding protein [Halomarina sp. BND7]